jgi:hypothetical protein
VRRGRPTLEMQISPDRLERVFDMDKGQQAVVRIKALGAEDDWHRFQATKVKMPGNQRGMVRAVG